MKPAPVVPRQKEKLALLTRRRKRKLVPLTLGRKEIAILAIIFLLVISLLSYLTASRVNSLRNISRELAKESVTLTEVRRVIGSREKYEEDINRLEGQVKSYEDKLPEKKEVPQLFRQLDKVASESQIKFVSVEEGLPEEGKQYRRYYWKLQLVGGYHELGRFINKLENLDRFIRVDNIQISTNPKNPLKHNIGLEVSTFVSKE